MRTNENKARITIIKSYKIYVSSSEGKLLDGPVLGGGPHVLGPAPQRRLLAQAHEGLGHVVHHQPQPGVALSWTGECCYIKREQHY